MKKLLALLLAAVMVFALAACNNSDNNETTAPQNDTEGTTDTTPATTEPTETEPERDILANYTYGTDYTSLYEQIGDQVNLEDVYDVDGIAYVVVDGVEYELGMDFLSMAMVYKTTPAEGATKFTDADAMYNEWWRLYIQRWNYLLPELPLYSNQYYHVYNSKLQNYYVNPYWGLDSNVVRMTIDTAKGANTLAMGSATDLTGSFRFASMGRTSPFASDLAIQNMTSGLDTVITDSVGTYQWNPTVVKEHTEVDNEDGTKTFTITINDGLVFSDGTPVTAKNFLTQVMVFSTPVGAEGAGRDHMSGMSLVGYADYAAYTGDGEANPVFSGIRLMEDGMTFSVTVSADYLPYYYDIAYAGFGAQPMGLWLGDFDIKDDGEGCYIVGDFYAKNGDSYVHAAHIQESKFDYTKYPFSGAYVVSEWDESELTAVLEINPNYPGDFEGYKPSIEKITYLKTVSETQIEWLTTGKLDVLQDVTGGNETAAALAVANENPDAYGTTYYNRAGYGKLHFRCDFGPASFTEVRQAIAYSMDRNAFAQTFTGGYGTVAQGPFYSGSAAYLANEDTISLNAYATSEAAAIAALEEGGWIYNAEGGEYTEGVRYKKLAKDEQIEANINYTSYNGEYATVEVNGEYYMPLVINWFCSENNEFSEQLKTAWAGSAITANIGMVVQYQQGTFTQLQGELYQMEDYGYAGTPMFSAFNFATGFTAAVYDYSWNWTVDPSLYDSYSIAYLKDEADIFWLD